MSARKVSEIVPTMLRIREGLRRRLARAAEFNEVSVNQEIADRLEISFVRDVREERDSAIVDLLVGNANYDAEILRKILREFQTHPNWWQQPGGTEDMAQRVAHYVRNVPHHPLYLDYDDAKLEADGAAPF
jgi:hypothetical protein